MKILRMSSLKPYLLRAHYEWLLDNNMTPYLVIDVNILGVNIPMDHANKGQVILNITPSAISNLELTNKIITFDTRFNGISRYVEVPMDAIIAIYARENGAGIVFRAESEYESCSADSILEKKHLVLVSNNKISNNEIKEERLSLSSDKELSKLPKVRPNLRVVK